MAIKNFPEIIRILLPTKTEHRPDLLSHTKELKQIDKTTAFRHWPSGMETPTAVPGVCLDSVQAAVQEEHRKHLKNDSLAFPTADENYNPQTQEGSQTTNTKHIEYTKAQETKLLSTSSETMS